MTNNNGANGGMELEITEEIAQGKYANLAIISHSMTEFIVDFATVFSVMPKARVNSRVILTPEHAKRLLYSLQENITRYETVHGPIEIQQREAMPSALTPMGEA